jgi:hypothetical protein
MAEIENISMFLYMQVVWHLQENPFGFSKFVKNLELANNTCGRCTVDET